MVPHPGWSHASALAAGLRGFLPTQGFWEGGFPDPLLWKSPADRAGGTASPIPCRLPRPVVFIPTTWQKFSQAEELNDLYDDSPLEDILWTDLKKEKIPAERQACFPSLIRAGPRARTVLELIAKNNPKQPKTTPLQLFF
jgi:hypothetical protein